MGAHPSSGLFFRWENSGTEGEEEDEAAAAGSDSSQPAGGEVSWPTAPCSTSPGAVSSPSWVGEEGGEGRDFFLLEDNSFRRLFFSLCTYFTFGLENNVRKLLRDFFSGAEQIKQTHV